MKVWVYKGDTLGRNDLPAVETPVLKTSVVPVVPVVTVAVMAVMALAVVAVVPQAPMPLLPMAATSLLALVLIPLSAFVRPTRPLQQRTVKENKHAATCTPQVP